MASETASYQPSFVGRLLVRFIHWIEPVLPWYKMPKLLGVLSLGVLRIELRAENLHDGYASGEVQGNATDDPMPDKRFLAFRNSDGKYNSLEQPLMGCAGMRFGRNFPRKDTPKPTDEQLWNPNPRLISEKFMTRQPGKFIPATTLNLLAAAWIQFQTHDWFFHEDAQDKFDIPLPEGDKWPHGKMILPKSLTDEVLDESDIKCPGYKNANTPWWDASQIYGSNEQVTRSLRTTHPDGKLKLTKEGREAFLPRGKDGLPDTGFNTNWWIGMELLHTLFALEHNALCDMLRAHHEDWTGDQIFDTARLINCALMAKIHTVEWTPAILSHPTVVSGMNTAWYGLAGETVNKLVGRISKNEIISGIPGSGTDQFGCPFSLTEEFVSVYRLHALLPDTIAWFKSGDGTHHSTVPIEDTIFTKAEQPFEAGLSFADVFYSFGINYPGAVTNYNYPNFLRDVTSPDGYTRDLGTVDILRDRERGVPRYTEFRRLIHMSVPKTFEELTGGNKKLAEELSEAYNGDIDLVDSIVGMHSEPLPSGFGFSETAFRVFILMAGRRLKSDRFIATQWNAETYTKEGLQWVQNNGMSSVIARHFPELEGVLKKSKNPFAPWQKLESSRKYSGIETTVKN